MRAGIYNPCSSVSSLFCQVETKPPEHLWRGDRSYFVLGSDQMAFPASKAGPRGPGTLSMAPERPARGMSHTSPPFGINAILQAQKGNFKSWHFEEGAEIRGPSEVGEKELRPQPWAAHGVWSYSQTGSAGDQVSCHRRTKHPPEPLKLCYTREALRAP